MNLGLLINAILSVQQCDERPNTSLIDKSWIHNPRAQVDTRLALPPVVSHKITPFGTQKPIFPYHGLMVMVSDGHQSLVTPTWWQVRQPQHFGSLDSYPDLFLVPWLHNLAARPTSRLSYPNLSVQKRPTTFRRHPPTTFRSVANLSAGAGPTACWPGLVFVDISVHRRVAVCRCSR